MIQTLTEENFSETVQSSKIVILHFWTDFCSPCKAMSSVLHRLNEKYSEDIIIGEINSQKHTDWMEAFGIQSTPTMVLFSEGTFKSKLSGAQPLSSVEKWIQETT